MNELHEQRLRVRDFFDRSSAWQGEYYDKLDSRFGRAVTRRMNYALDMIDVAVGDTRGTVLDVGCGSGVYLQQLYRKGWDVYGSDISPVMVDVTRSRFSRQYGATSDRFVCADVMSLPFTDATFDLILCVGVLGYVEDSLAAISEISRVLVPGGLLLISVENAISLSNIDYFLRHRIRASAGSHSFTPSNQISMLSPWMTAHSETHYAYSLHHPGHLEHHLRRMGFGLLDHMTFGYQFRLLRATGILPDTTVESLEVALERRLRHTRLPYLRYSGDAYTGLYRKLIGGYANA